MHLYKIFKNNNHIIVVKSGFSWTALCFGWIWFFVKKLWFFGVIFLFLDITFVTLQVMYLDKTIILLLFLSFVIYTSTRYFIARQANQLIENKAIALGYNLKESILAANTERAMDQYNNLHSHIIEE